MWVKLGKPKFTSKQRSDALGQRFDRKVKFCKTIGKLSSHQSEIIHICHRYRNELYHAGLKYNDIVWDIAWFYHDLAIELLASVYPDHSWYSGATVTEAVEKHAGEGGRKVLMEMGAVANSLRNSKPKQATSLQEALSSSALSRVEETTDALKFLVTDDPQRRTEENTIYELQFYDYIQSDEQLVKAIWNKVKSFEQREAALSFIKKVWEPKYSCNPLPHFERSAKKISQQKTELGALKSFERFKKEFSYFFGIVEEAAIALDGYIQQQIDIARGK